MEEIYNITIMGMNCSVWTRLKISHNADNTLSPFPRYRQNDKYLVERQKNYDNIVILSMSFSM